MDTTIEFTSKNWSRTYIICPILNRSKHISQLGHRLHIWHKLARYSKLQWHNGKVCTEQLWPLLVRVLLHAIILQSPYGQLGLHTNHTESTRTGSDSAQSTRSPHGHTRTVRSPRGVHTDTWGTVNYWIFRSVITCTRHRYSMLG